MFDGVNYILSYHFIAAALAVEGGVRVGALGWAETFG